jgi:hypothetical protein
VAVFCCWCGGDCKQWHDHKCFISRSWYRLGIKNDVCAWDFGAYGNGVNDDTAAIQSEIKDKISHRAKAFEQLRVARVGWFSEA